MNIAIIVAGGKGERMQAGENKVFLKLRNKEMISSTLYKFNSCKSIDSIIIVTREEDIERMKRMVERDGYSKVEEVIIGGKERQDSVYSGIKKAIEIGKEEDIILIHNGCNPFVSKEEIMKSIQAAEKHDAAVCAFPLKDTIKRVKQGFVFETVPRENVWQMQTPQAMRLGLAKQAFEKAFQDGHYATDDVALVERLGKKVRIVPCSHRNFKITTPEDYEIARDFTGSVGIGKDSHRFCDNKELVLGGIKIDYPKGLEAVSDGDVILHSLFNAISSALGERSIGYYFPRSDPKNHNRDSKEFFLKIHEMLDEKGYSVNDISISIEAKEPMMERYAERMKKSIAKLLEMSEENVGLTFTSGEELTEAGKGMGIESVSYVSLRKND